MRPVRIFALVLVGAFILSACGDDAEPTDLGSGTTGVGATGASGPEEATGAEPSPEPGDEPASGAVTYTAVDFGFDGPSELAAGEVEITLENAGAEPHELVVFPVAEGTTIDDVMTYLEENPDSEEIPDFVLAEPVATFARPGRVSKRTLVASLDPGTYMMTCFVPSKSHDHLPHALLGMVREITVV